MPRKPSKYKQVIDSIPEFIKSIENSQSEKEVDEKCQQIKASIDQASGKVEGRRDPVTMAAIRRTIDEKFPIKSATPETVAEFPYYLSSSKKGKEARLEHVAHKYLVDEKNPKKEKSEVVKPEVVKPEVVKPERVKPEVDILDEVGLTNDEVEQVKKALGESDVREWVRQAIMQRASAINNKKAVMDEDLLEVPSEILMNEKKYRTNPTAARELINRAVRVVKQWNHDHPDQKWCITNKLIGELTGVTVKAIAKAVEAMDLESYNKSHDLTPVVNRMVKGAVGEASQVMSIANVTGIEGTEENYR
jgi:hypothetical protein